MPLISMFPCSTGGTSIDYNSRPQIDFDGKWIKPFVEFYDGEPYWEAWFLSSGTLTVNGTYTADVWLLGGGAIQADFGTRRSERGSATIAENIILSQNIAVTIGGGGSTYRGNGGTTSLGSLASAAGGVVDTDSSGDPYRFSDPDKANEAGANATSGLGGYDVPGQGGWQYLRSSPKYEGEGYGAGGGYYRGTVFPAHSGALVIRIKI